MCTDQETRIGGKYMQIRHSCSKQYTKEECRPIHIKTINTLTVNNLEEVYISVYSVIIFTNSAL